MTPEEEALLYPKLLRIAEYLLEQMESFDRRFHTAIQLEEQAAKLANLSPIEGLTLRLQGLMDAVLKMLEGYLQMQPHSDRNLLERAQDIEDTVWDWIYRRDVDIQTLSDVERGLAALVASEAHQHLWHMRWVENFVVVTGHYLGFAEKVFPGGRSQESGVSSRSSVVSGFVALFFCTSLCTTRRIMQGF